MPDPRWTGPPEVVALIFETGSPASIIANNAVWVTETVHNELSAGLSTINNLATAAQWEGVGSVASTAVSIGLNAGLHTLVGWTAEKITITQAALEAFTIARSAVIPSMLCQTNRDEWATLNATNFFGQNTPAIVERDTEYFGEHWPHNSSVGWTYSAALSGLLAALAVPPPLTPMGASPTAPAAATSAVTQAAAQTAMNDAIQLSAQSTQTAGQASSSPAETTGQFGSLLQQPLQMMSSATAPLKELAQAPAQAVNGFTSMPQSLMQSLGGMFPSALATNAAEAASGPVTTSGGGISGLSSAGTGGGLPGAGLTSYTRPASTFEPEGGGRPRGLRAGVLNAAELRSPTTSGAMGGAPMPMSPAGMLAHGHGSAAEDKKTAARARIVVSGDSADQG
ncbi:MAG: PPE family protein [Mycobacteriaceae bacterium]|nr:PPE family protein [Mycobacteriaceae bacterium]